MRFAYADPPYPGQAKKWYRDHPDYAGEVDHAELIGRLCRDYPDGWALSTSAAAIRDVLPLCPEKVRVAAWYRTNTPPPVPGARWHWCWEPVIVHGGRVKRAECPIVVKDVLASGFCITGGIAGHKPAAFVRWVLDLLGYQDGDTIDDLFPGSGAVGRGFAARSAQGSLL